MYLLIMTSFIIITLLLCVLHVTFDLLTKGTTTELILFNIDVWSDFIDGKLDLFSCFLLWFLTVRAFIFSIYFHMMLIIKNPENESLFTKRNLITEILIVYEERLSQIKRD